ncbi:phospholipid phosphatase 2-like isoform X2 [Homarus americanus]|uniref:phospholipid phosphatase 2-like isoform X2 n=1 Tax=Homarus americanus TaxID=6706 RepID=UPI001C4862C1|nr:phospholipid phosphatase 2-like isoform X2 [Homarus americanus]XP_042212998.1 phospholipid phosphatase 2-like isoform X2 [Homarus americanus]
MRCFSTRVCRMAFDIFLYLTVAACLVVTLLGIVPPSHTVISCADPTIRMNYQFDTIPVSMLVCISLFLPFFVMMVMEWALPPSSVVLGTSPFRSGLRRGWSYTTDLFVGGLFMYFINDVAKTVTAEARPNFWDSCRPNITEEHCQQKYIMLTWRDCINPYGLSHPRLVDTMKSFPSGHASISVFSSVFMIVYIKQRLWNRCSLLLAPWLQLIWAVWTLICCQSRIWDNKHHWWDVLGGGLLGAFGAFMTLHYLSNWFIREDDLDKPSSRDLPFHCQEDRSSGFSRNSVKRLISNTSDTDNHSDLRHDDRELRDINGTP